MYIIMLLRHCPSNDLCRSVTAASIFPGAPLVMHACLTGPSSSPRLVRLGAEVRGPRDLGCEVFFRVLVHAHSIVHTWDAWWFNSFQAMCMQRQGLFAAWSLTAGGLCLMPLRVCGVCGVVQWTGWVFKHAPPHQLKAMAGPVTHRWASSSVGGHSGCSVLY